MKESWDKAIEFVFLMEGGYINDSHDPGGETNFGISKRAYPSVDIGNLTKETAEGIYKRDYWDVCNCDALDYPMDVLVFDTAVNMGVGKAKSLKSSSDSPADFLFQRLASYVSFRNFRYFGTGWTSRVIKLYMRFCR